MNAAHCIIKALNTIDEDVNLILEQNDVTHDVEKNNDCIFFTNSIRNPITTCTMECFFCFKMLVAPSQREFKKNNTGRNAWPVSFYIYVDVHIHISTYTYFCSVSGFVYMIYIYIYMYIAV